VGLWGNNQIFYIRNNLNLILWGALSHEKIHLQLTFVFVWEQDQNNCRLFGHCGYYVLKGPFGPLVF
jgi:hypothetical protein